MAIRTGKSIIYHIPKCGGTWVKVAMEAAGLEYRPMRNVKESHPFNLKTAHATPDVVLPRDTRDRFGMCFVRQPGTWYSSFWSFRSRKGARRDQKFPADGLWSDDFAEFVNNVLDAYPGGFVTALYQYYTGADGRKVDFIGRQEYLADDLVMGLTLAGETFDEAALRATRPNTVSLWKWKKLCELDSVTRARVRDSERWVLETFYA